MFHRTHDVDWGREKATPTTKRWFCLVINHLWGVRNSCRVSVRGRMWWDNVSLSDDMTRNVSIFAHYNKHHHPRYIDRATTFGLTSVKYIDINNSVGWGSVVKLDEKTRKWTRIKNHPIHNYWKAPTSELLAKANMRFIKGKNEMILLTLRHRHDGAESSESKLIRRKMW